MLPCFNRLISVPVISLLGVIVLIYEGAIRTYFFALIPLVDVCFWILEHQFVKRLDECVEFIIGVNANVPEAVKGGRMPLLTTKTALDWEY